jgi:iron complex outermembrane recepter protein
MRSFACRAVFALGSAWVFLACVAPVPAVAQEEPEATEPAWEVPGEPTPPAGQAEAAAAEPVATIPVPPLAPEPAAAPEAVELDVVKVTARKRTESLQEVPLSVTAYSASEIDRRGFAGLEDIARATPGFTFEPYMTGGAHAAPVMRGLAQTFTTARIQNVSFFIDGVYLQRQSMVDLGMVDLERIEVMKGPQNALYGRNAFAGAVNYITLVPASNTEGYLMTGSGDNDRKLFRLGVTGPLNEDGSIYGKITLGRGTYEGHTPNNHPVANADPPGENLRGNLGGFEDETYSFSLAWEPDQAPGLKLRTNYYYSDLVHETGPGYSISGVHAARFNLRFDHENDLNCLPGSVPDISPNSQGPHVGNTAWCGELPKYASDIPNYTHPTDGSIPSRRVQGMVVDPRAIGSTSKTGVITAIADYELRDGLSLHYLFGDTVHDSYTDGGASDEDPVAGRGINVDASKDSQDETAYVFANTASGRPNSILRSSSHELRANWEFNDRLRLSGGLYHSTVTDQEWVTLFISKLCNADSAENIAHCNEHISVDNEIDEQTVLTVGVAYDQYARISGGKVRTEWSEFEDKIQAVFGSASYDLTDSIEATLEARYSVEKKQIRRFTDAQGLGPGTQECIDYSDQTPVPIIPIPATTTFCSSIAKVVDEAEFRDVTPRGILTWDWSPANMVYGSVARGIKAGGFNNSGVPGEQTYDQEKNWTYELGSKNRFFGFLTVNAALYYIDWTNLQGQSPPEIVTLSSSDIVDNIGGASSTGLELEAMAFLTRNLSVDLGLSLADAKYDDGVVFQAANINQPEDQNGNVRVTGRKIHCDDVICPADGDISGNQLARTSKVQGSLGLNYIQDWNAWTFNARLDTNYQSKQYIEPVNLSWVPARQITNASLKVNFPDWHWELNTWVKNLTDEDYVANSFYIGVFDQYMVGKGAPRTWGATLKYKF